MTAIEISANENVGSVRKIISLYFMGFNTIAIKPKDGRFSRRLLMGAEIIRFKLGHHFAGSCKSSRAYSRRGV